MRINETRLETVNGITYRITRVRGAFSRQAYYRVVEVFSDGSTSSSVIFYTLRSFRSLVRKRNLSSVL